MKKKSVSLTFFPSMRRHLEVARFGEVEWRRSGCTSATASTICSRRDESRAAAFFCWSVVEFPLRGSIGMEMKRSYGFSRWSVVWEGTQYPVRDQRQIRQSSPWTTASSVFIFCTAAESAVEDSRRPEQLRSSVFFRRSKLRSCLLGLEETKKEENLEMAATTNSTRWLFLAFIFSAVVESVLEGSNGWQQLWRLKKLTLSLTVLKRTES